MGLNLEINIFMWYHYISSKEMKNYEKSMV
nr:MAG TPA: hypothetical protein [Inoviridae sp.]